MSKKTSCNKDWMFVAACSIENASALSESLTVSFYKYGAGPLPAAQV